MPGTGKRQFIYSDASEFKCSGATCGFQGPSSKLVYGGGGFVKQLPTVAENRTVIIAQTLVKQLWDSRFIDRYTSAIFVESTLYDPTRHALVLLRLVLELPPSGLGAQFTCFNSTQVQTLTQKMLLVLPTLEVSAVAVAMLYPQEGGGGYIALEAFVLAGVLVLSLLA